MQPPQSATKKQVQITFEKVIYSIKAKLYRIGKDYDNAVKVYEKCVKCNEKMNE